MPTLARAVPRIASTLRTLRPRLSPGVSLGSAVRLGQGVLIKAAPGAHIVIGDAVEVGANTQIIAESGARIAIGRRTFISGSCIIAAHQLVEIGMETMIAELVSISDHDHDPDAPPRSGKVLISDVTVGDRVWLGAKCSIVRGGSVGSDSVVGAHALVNRAVPASVLAVGVPARVARHKKRREGGR